MVRVTPSLNPPTDSSFAAREELASCARFQKANSNSPFLDFFFSSSLNQLLFAFITSSLQWYVCNTLRGFFSLLYSEQVICNAVFQQLSPHLAPFSRLSPYASKYLRLRRENDLRLRILFYIFFLNLKYCVMMVML